MQPPQPPQAAEPPPEQPAYPPYSSQPPYEQPPYEQPAFPGTSPQPPQYGYYPPPTYVQPVYAPPTSTSAIVSLVCSIASWFVLPFIGAIVGVAFGHIARREIRQSNGTIKGDGLAIAGLIVGYLQIALWVILILIFVWIFIIFATNRNTVF